MRRGNNDCHRLIPGASPGESKTDLARQRSVVPLVLMLRKTPPYFWRIDCPQGDLLIVLHLALTKSGKGKDIWLVGTGSDTQEQKTKKQNRAPHDLTAES